MNLPTAKAGGRFTRDDLSQEEVQRQQYCLLDDFVQQLHPAELAGDRIGARIRHLSQEEDANSLIYGGAEAHHQQRCVQPIVDFGLSHGVPPGLEA